MTHIILISRTIEKKLNTMRRAGRKGELAANQCENLLAQIQREGLLVKDVYTKRTKNGECRISNCIKYDLGNGYRLVTIKHGHDLFVPFVGTHDETDLWLDRHKYDVYHRDDPAYMDTEIPAIYDLQPEEADDPGQGSPTITDQYEEQLLDRIDETLLKSIFPGLFNKQQT